MDAELFAQIEKELSNLADVESLNEGFASILVRTLWGLYVEPPQTTEEANARFAMALGSWTTELTGNQFKDTEVSAYLASKVASEPVLGKEVVEQVTKAPSFHAFMDRKISKKNSDDEFDDAMRAAWRCWRPKLTKISTNLVSSVKDVYQEFIVWLRQHPTALDKIAWEAFERLVAEIFAGRGFSVDLTGRVRNQSADIIAIRTDEFGVRTKYLVECKRCKDTSRIGLDVVNAVLGAKARASADHAFLVTSTLFTQDVEREKQKFEDLRLHLRDGNAVREWLQDYTVRSDGGLWLAPGWNDGT